MADIVYFTKDISGFNSIIASLGTTKLCHLVPQSVVMPSDKKAMFSMPYYEIISKDSKLPRINTHTQIAVRSHLFIRELLEQMPEKSIIFGLESDPREDFLHHRSSGFNQITCKLAARKHIAYAISFADFLAKTPLQRAKIYGRIQQNIGLCRKYGVKILIASFAKHPYELRSSKDLQGFGEFLGLTPPEAKAATQSLSVICP